MSLPRRARVVGCALSLVLAAAPLGAQIRVVARAELAADARVRVRAAYDSVPAGVRDATMAALRDAGLTVLTDEARQPDEQLLLLHARCDRDWMRRWRCREFSLRLVDVATSEVRASAVLVPLAPQPTRLAVIGDSLRAGLRRRGGR